MRALKQKGVAILLTPDVEVHDVPESRHRPAHALRQ
jgi:hypothetical protein